MRSLLLALLALPASAEEMTLQQQRNLSREQCLKLAPAEIVTRCPLYAGRFLSIDKQHAAFVDRADERKGTDFCEENGAWHCRRIVVLEYETRGIKKRDPQKFVTAGALLSRLATAPSVRINDDFGALQAPVIPPRTCLDSASRGCAVQAARLRARAPDKAGTPTVRRRLWLVEDADGTTLQCSDAELTRCDELTAAGWTLLALTMRPSSLAPPEPAPELDTPDSRTDRRPSAVVSEGSDSAAGQVQEWLKPKAGKILPRTPSRGDITKAAHALEAAGGLCVTAQAAVGVLFSGEGSLLSLTVDGAENGDPRIACLTNAARKLAFPRFAGNSYQLHALVLPRAVVNQGRAHH
jgi:hypothetical protein